MMKRWVVGIVVLQLVACAHLHLSPKPKPIKSVQSLTEFNRVAIEGAMNVRLHTGAIRPALLVHGDPRDREKVVWRVRHHTLTITLNKLYPKYGPVDVDISTRYLSSFKYHGTGFIQGYQLRSDQLDLDIVNRGPTSLIGQLNLRHVTLGGAGKIYLKPGKSLVTNLYVTNKAHVNFVGVTSLQKLRMRGQAWLSMYWVKSPSLQIRLSDQARVQIAGATDLLQVDQRGSSLFNGRYLRAKEAFVKTHDKATADIAATQSQHTLAKDDSNIYYHESPVFETDFMGSNGAVLDLGAWERF